MKIYIDNDYKCHLSNVDDLREIETDFFEGKCQRFIEGYRFVPTGESWTRSDGKVFAGEMISPWQPYEILTAYQEQYEESRAELEDLTAAVNAYQEGTVIV